LLAYVLFITSTLLAGCTARHKSPEEMSMSSNDPIATALIVQEAEALVPGKPYSTHNIIRINVTYGEISWTAYAGPNPEQTDPAVVTLELSPAPSLSILGGWIYVWGQSPNGRTRRIKAGGSGTTMMVQHQGPSDGGIHRVFFMAEPGDHVDVILDNNPSTLATLDQIGTYFEVGPSDTTIPPAILLSEAPAEVTALVAYVLANVNVA
jgi:hypothetical protein